jgi:hypothetical protein
MMQIVSSPWQIHYYQVSDYSTIDRALVNLTPQLCAEASSSVLPSIQSTIATSPTVTTATTNATVATAATTSDGKIFIFDLIRLVFQNFGPRVE